MKDVIESAIHFWDDYTDALDAKDFREESDLLNLQEALRWGLQLDETRVDATNLLDKLIPLIDASSTWEVWQELILSSWQLNEGELKYHMGYRWGYALLKLERDKDAEQILLAVLDSASDSGGQATLARLHYTLCIYYYSNQILADAKHHGLQAEAIVQQNPSLDYMAKGIYNQLGLIQYDLGNYGDAVVSLDAAAARLNDVSAESSLYLARVLINKARALRQQATVWSNIGYII